MSRNLIALQNKFLGHGQTVYDALSRLRAEQGYVGDADIERIAQEFHLPRAHVRATAKFYEELSHSTPAKRVVKLCNGEACRCAGYESAAETLRERLGVAEMGGTNAAGVRLEHVTCLGYCGLGPNAMLDGLPVSLAGPGGLDRVVAWATEGRDPGWAEPSNPCYAPPAGKPNVLMRRLTGDATSLAAARAAGAYAALEKAVRGMTPEQVIREIKTSQIRGRGGAGFPAGIKLDTVRNAGAPGERKFVVVNGDEGDAGSYIDKELFERDPHGQLEGVLIAAYATGAREAIIYIRFEYPRAIAVIKRAIEEARGAGLVGAPLFGSEFACEIRVVQGQGAYICGEETSLLRSIEGVPAIVSYKPPFPAEKGLWGCPTAVNNVETIHNFPWIIERGGAAYAALGVDRSRGTKLVSLNTRVKRPGLYEVELGTTLREVIFGLAGGMEDGQRFRAVQVGGPLGGIFPERLLDTALDFEAMAKAGGMLGHAGIVVYSEADDLIEIGRALMHFCAVESCGKCFPCRIGAVRGTELFDQMLETGVTDARLSLLRELCDTMEIGSLCALGGMIPIPIRNLVQFFPEEFERRRASAAAEA
jgi:NADH:ubiquinone oxidoreductase subunit F (NADH-binding)/NADH:ubiquinone oxidoreductase subunit E